MAITFHSGDEVPFSDYWRAGKKLEAFFRTDQDPTQAAIKPAEARWIINNIPKCVTIIRDGSEVIGLTFFFPTSRALMRQFLAKQISEHTLWERAKRNISSKDNTCVYLASAFLDQPYRRRGFIQKSFERSLRKYLSTTKMAHQLFFWGYSPEGKALSRRVASRLELPLKEKKIISRRRGASGTTNKRKPLAKRR